MASKEAYQQKLAAQLKEWDAKLDVLSAKARQATADARIGYENELEALKARRAAAQEALQELARRSESAWEDVRDAAEKAWEDMGKAMEKITARFK